MASLYNKFLDFIGIEETDDMEDEGYYRDEPADRYDRDRDRDRDRNRDRDRDQDRDNVVNFGSRSSGRRDRGQSAQNSAGGLPISGGMKMIVYHPVSYEDTQNIIDNLKNRKPVIVNMEELEMETAQRILDFLSGAVYALNGTMCKISRGIFVVAPNNYDVVGNGDEDYDEDNR